MEGDANSSECRNDVLSQSYIESVERVAQQDKRDPRVPFDLPKEVVQQREKDWSKFFDKYANEVPNDIELNMFTMQPVDNEKNKEEEEAEEEDDDEDENENNEEQKEYYSKCRAPIRKLPALIQYWVDTGNPPYQLTGDEDHSDTGSSLSEGEYSRSNESAALRKSIEDPKFDENSPCSSVDTAAYVLSNTNVTKKAKTLEIVEGAKETNEKSRVEIAVPIREHSNAIIVTDKAPKPSDNSRINKRPETPPGQPPVNCMTTPSSSVMLREVLPALQQFDDLLEKSEQLKPPSSVFSKVRRIRKRSVAKSKAKETVMSPDASQRDQNLLETTNDSTKTTNRRKLYTGRNSPCDLIMTENASNSLTTGPDTHPALEPAGTTKNPTSRPRVRRKRKRPSLAPTATMSDLLRSVIHSTSQKTLELTQDDRNNNNNTEKEGNERYTEFFESLGLTPKKISTNNNGDKIEKRPGTRRHLRMKMNNRIAHTTRQGESPKSLESSTKETENSFSRDLDDSLKTDSNPTNRETEILGNKVLTICITRLPDEALARCRQRTSEPLIRQSDGLAHHVSPNIEVLTTASNDSDSSTIIMYSCNQANGDQCYDSEDLFSQKISSSSTSDLENARKIEDSCSATRCSTTKFTGRNIVIKATDPSPVEASSKTLARFPEINNWPKLVVELEKLPLKQQPNVTKPKIAVDPESRDLGAKNSENSRPVGPSDSTENYTSCITPGPRKSDVSKKIEKLRTDRNKRFSFGFNFKTSAGGDDDCFVKLIQKKASTPLKNPENSEKCRIVARQDRAKERMNGTREMNVERIQKSYLAIATSSDEEKDDSDRVTFSRKCRSRKRPKKIDPKVVHEDPQRSNNRRKIIDGLTNNSTNAIKMSAEFENLFDKSENKEGRDESSSGNSRNSSFRRSGRKRLGSNRFNGAIDTDDSPRESRNRGKIVDIRKNKKSMNFTEDLIESRSKKSVPNVESNFGRAKRKSIEPDTSRDDEKNETSRSLRFCTRLSSNSDSNFDSVSEEQISVDTNKKSIKNKPIPPKADPINEFEKVTKNNFDNKVITANGKPHKESNQLISFHNSSTKNSRVDTKASHSRSKNNMKTRLRETATKKVRRTRVLGTPIEFESDDDSGSAKQNSLINEKTTKRSEYASSESTSPEKRQNYLQNFFPHIPDNPIKNIDNIFASTDNSAQKISNKYMKTSVKPIINKHLINVRKPTITFRTQLTSDSDNDTDL